MSRLAASHLGSGTVPYILPGASGQTTPHGSEGDVLFNREGESIIIVNPEDFSCYRNGVTKQIALTGGAAAAKLDVSLENRRAIAIANTHATAVLYIGFHPEVTISNGWPIFASTSLSINCSNKLQVYGVSASNITVGVMEVA